MTIDQLTKHQVVPQFDNKKHEPGTFMFSSINQYWLYITYLRQWTFDQIDVWMTVVAPTKNCG
jgi:hypothetical protein